ncbi:MAG: hypothetical protein IJ679_06580 [Lachnospiraceae bacterium]|nr:hypothetical protein [Lachnospiraceae bacterium]
MKKRNKALLLGVALLSSAIASPIAGEMNAAAANAVYLSSEAIVLGANQQYEANIFLSNFAEQDISSFDINTASTRDLVDFAFLHALINRRSNIQYAGNYCFISMANINDILNRFFDITLSNSQMAGYTNAYGDGYFSNGNVYWSAGAGEMHLGLTIVDRADRLSDGSIQLTYTDYKYVVGPDEDGVPSSIYGLAPSEAAASSRLSKRGHGVAIVVPYSYNGKQSYQLRRMYSTGY